jgi:hypothetical protein
MHERDQVLLGVTGSGKTFTMAHVIQATQRPALILAPNKTLAAQLYGEIPSVLPRQRGRVLRLLLRLLPARGLRAAHRHLHREGKLDQRADRPDAPLRHPRAAGARRRDHRRLRVVHLRHRRRGDLLRDDLPAERASASPSASCWQTSSRCNTSATTRPSSAAPSGCAATRSRCSRPPGRPRLAAVASSATSSRRSSSSTRSPATSPPSSKASRSTPTRTTSRPSRPSTRP